MANSGDNERKPSPAPFWTAPQPAKAPTPDPPITRQVVLPEKVAVKYLAEASGQDLNIIVALMRELHIIVSVDRSVDFEDAVKILRRYGIAAKKAV
jgi:hypothetical protein